MRVLALTRRHAAAARRQTPSASMRRAGTPGRGVRGTEAGAAGAGAATGVRAEEEVLFGVRSVGGVAPGFFKENQDDAFVARKNFAHNSPGSHKDFFAAVMDGHGLAGKHVSGFVKSQLTQDVRYPTPWLQTRREDIHRAGTSHRQAVSCG